MDDAEDLPRYEEEGPDFQTSIQELLSSLGGDFELPVHKYPEYSWSRPEDAHLAVRDMYAQIVSTYFGAIRAKNRDVVAAMIENNIVTPETTDRNGESPLLAAIDKDDVRMVQCLVDFGADIDRFGAWEGTQRTPLQLAASKGHLTLVRLLVEVFHADDAKLAPDGELALRLAAKGNHHDVVRYLPSRRKGGLLRWKTHHAKAMRRIRKAYRAIIWFGRVTCWEIPRFFLWSCPKHLIVLPAYKGLKWTWKKRHAAANWCVYQVHELPHRIQRASVAVATWGKEVGIATGKLVQKIPAAAIGVSKSVWKFFTTTIPRLLRKALKFLIVLITQRIPQFITSTAKWTGNFLKLLFTKWIPRVFKWVWKFLVDLITKRIPRVARHCSQWVWDGVKGIAEALLNIVQRVLSFLHTAVMAIISRLQQITLQDVWNAFCSVLHAVFVAVPQKVWAWVSKIPSVIYRTLETLFGVFGEIIAWIGYALIFVVVYVPTQLVIMVQSLGGSMAKGGEEILVWINPKR